MNQLLSAEMLEEQKIDRCVDKKMGGRTKEQISTKRFFYFNAYVLNELQTKMTFKSIRSKVLKAAT